jgi:hypothetical protein
MITLFLLALDRAIVVNEPRKRRKVCKEEFNKQKDYDSLWMGCTIKYINKDLDVCDKENQDLDKEKERLMEQRES